MSPWIRPILLILILLVLWDLTIRVFHIPPYLIPAPEAVMIGDTPYDAEAGLEAGTKAAGLLTGGFKEEILLQAGCFAAADSLQRLLRCLESGERVTQRQTIMDNLIECPKHNGRFDFTSGKAKGAPVCVDLKTYPVKIEGSEVFIQI